jgi:hypothetical protein
VLTEILQELAESGDGEIVTGAINLGFGMYRGLTWDLRARNSILAYRPGHCDSLVIRPVNLWLDTCTWAKGIHDSHEAHFKYNCKEFV